MEQPPTPVDNETEVHYIMHRTFFAFTVADPAVYLRLASKADDEAVFGITAANEGATQTHPGLPRPDSTYTNHAFDVSLEYELTEGLEFAPGPLPHDVERIDDRTRRWNVGTIIGDETTTFDAFTELEVPVVISAFPSVGDLPLSERCLTASVVKVSPAFKLDPRKQENNVATLCVENPKRILSEWGFTLFDFFPCIDAQSLPCTGTDALELLVEHEEERLQPDAVIFHVDPVFGKTTSGGTTFWSMANGLTLYTSLDALDSSVWASPFADFTVTGIDAGSPPGPFTKRFLNDDGSEILSIVLTDTTTFTQDLVETGVRYLIGVEFGDLGNYILTVDIRATHNTAGTLADTANYVFHVGPIAELAVMDSGERSPLAAGQIAYTIHASSHGPDTASAVQVTLSDVPEGADAILSEGSYEQGDCDTSGLCGGTWFIGEMLASGPRSFEGKIAYPTLTLIAPDGAPTPNIQATIANVADYEVCIDADGNDVLPIPAGETACEATSGNSWHSTHYFDYIDDNNEATIEARAGAGGPVPGTPQRLNVRTYLDPPLALVSWDPVERLNGWPVSGYEVREFAPPCQLPAPDAEATATVGGELYLDTDLDAGEEKCYAVRAVNSRGVGGYWSMVSVGGDRGATMTPQSLTVAENGGTGHYTVVLDAQPRSTVTVTFASADTNVATVRSALSDSRLLFGPGNWDIPQRVTVTGVDDDLDNPDDRRSTVIRHSLSGAGYNNVPGPPVRVTVTDDDGPGVGPQQRTATVSKSSLTLAEGMGTDTYTVSLSHPAESAVELTFTHDSSVTVSPPRASFAVGGRGPKTITVTAVDDTIMNPDGQRTATIRHTLSGGGYDGVSVPDVSVTLLDNDVPASVSKSEDSLTVSEAGGTGSYTVSLNKKPTGRATVRLSVGGDNPGAVRVTPTALTFTPEKWRMPQTVTVVGQNDQAVTGARRATIEHEVVGGGYGGVTLGPVAVTISDDDAPAITLSEKALTVSETEGLRQDTYLVSLSGQPAGDVTVSISSSDEAVARINPRQVTFAPNEWNIPWVITVTGQDDDVVNEGGERRATIRHTASGGGDFDGVTEELEVTVANDDEVDIKVSASTDDGILYVKDGGQSNSYTVRLGSRPSHDVVVFITNSNADDFEVDDWFVISPDEWRSGKQVNVRSKSGAASDATATITHTAASDDPQYDGEDVDDVTVQLVPTPRVRVEWVDEKVAGGQRARLEVYAERTLFDDLQVNVFMGTNYAVLNEGQDRMVTIESGKRSVVFEVATKNPWTTRTDGRTRDRCTPGNIHANVSWPRGEGTYHYNGDESVWLEVYHSDEFDSCN